MTAKNIQESNLLPTKTGLRAAPGKSGLHARGEGERVMALESREGKIGRAHV